jgi:glycosyltransferase involved in cell wall biosynthesis
VFVSNSEHGVDHLVEEWGAPRERISVIRAGIEPPRARASREEWRSRLGLGPDDFAACMLAHFRKSKDHATLLRAWRLVVDRLAPGRRAVLLLAGDPYPMQDVAKALAFDLRLDDAVRFLGDVDDIYGLVAACDVGVLSSFREGFPVSVLEFMVSGLPVAGADIAGIREVVGPEGYPFLAPAGDTESLASAIVRLADDGELRARLGALNRERVLSEFNTERMVDDYSEVLSRALADGRAGARLRIRR